MANTCLPRVTPGHLHRAAELSGFKRLEHKAVELSAQAAVTIDLALEIGPGQRVGERDGGSASAADGRRVHRAKSIDAQQITDLPILGRNAFFEEKLAQSVVFVNNPTMGRMQDQNANSDVSISGGPAAYQQRAGGRHLHHGFEQPRGVHSVAGSASGSQASRRHL